MSAWWGSGFLTQLIYAAGSSVVDDSFALLTENSLNITTEDNNNIDVENN